jgi:hypothetical protein
MVTVDMLAKALIRLGFFSKLLAARKKFMKIGAAIAEIMKREGIEILTGYPVNHLREFAADINIRPVIVRQERIGLHMADDQCSFVTSWKPDDIADAIDNSFPCAAPSCGTWQDQPI